MRWIKANEVRYELLGMAEPESGMVRFVLISRRDDG